jgi:hypothetical protein
MKLKKKTMSEEDVKKALDIPDFRSLTKEKVMEFVSIIPKVDKEVAVSIISQFPNYVDMSKDMIGGMVQLCNNALENENIGNKEVIESYKLILESLNKRLDNDNLSFDEKNKITEEMAKVADKIDTINDKHKLFIKDIITRAGGTIAGVIIVGAAILGAIDNSKNR